MSRVHVFGDEAGDLVFKPPGNGVSRYFMIGTITLEDCSVGEEFLALRRELAWEGVLVDQLHATSDRQHVRDRAFELIAATDLRFDATILTSEKPRTSFGPTPSISTSWPGTSISSTWPLGSLIRTTSYW